MIYFYYGKNTYFVKELAQGFETKFFNEQGGDLNISHLEGRITDQRKINESCKTLPFLGERRLVVIRNLLLENSDKELQRALISDLEKLPDFTDLLIVEMGEPDKRTALFKFLEKKATAKDCQPLAGTQLYSVLVKRCEREGITLPLVVAAELVDYAGDDLWRLQNEIRKLIDYAKSVQSKSIDKTMVEQLVDQAFSEKIFSLTDAMLSRNASRAVSLLENFINSGEEPLMILNMIVFQLRQLLVVADLQRRGVINSAIASRGQIKPFIVNRLISSLKSFSWQKLCASYLELAEIDTKIKNGRGEPKLLLTLFTVAFSKSS